MSASDEAPPARGRVRAGIKVAVVVGLALGLVAAVSSADLAPDLSHLDVVVFSGAPEGNYHAVVEAMAREAASRGGRIENVSTAGSLDNVRRLEGEPQDPRGRFALVQAGSDWKPDTGLRLIARLPASDTVLFLGRDADRLTRLAQLAGLRVGIGPEGSGTARVARHLFERPELAPLGVETSHHTLEAQLDLLERGELDLGVFVIEERAELIVDAVRRRGLQIAGFEHARALAQLAPPLRVGRIAAGAYEPVAVLPPLDKPVLQLDTLVLGDGRASHSETIALLQLLTYVYPELIDHNRAETADAGLPRDPRAQAFFDARGPDLLTEYAPWLADLVPLGNLVHLVMAVSILFNLMGGGNKFALWRIDAARVRLEAELAELFGEPITAAELARREPQEADRAPERRARLERVVSELLTLQLRCRKLSVSPLVPMGGEMSYRYQEDLIAKWLVAVREHLARQ